MSVEYYRSPVCGLAPACGCGIWPTVERNDLVFINDLTLQRCDLLYSTQTKSTEKKWLGNYDVCQERPSLSQNCISS